MNKRDRAFRRKVRAKHIHRKKAITAHYPASDECSYYKFDGMFSKGKIHCSCPLCSSKSYYGKHVLTMQEKRDRLNEYDYRKEI